MTKTVSREELQTLMNGDASPVVLEALPERYFAEGHLPGAQHLPHDAVAERASDMVPDKDAAIVVYCANDACRNSHKAARAFLELGYTDVAVYPGGKQDWMEAGLPLEKD